MALDPLLTKVAGQFPSGADFVSPDPLLTPSKIVRRFPSGADSVSPDPHIIIKSETFQGKNP